MQAESGDPYNNRMRALVVLVGTLSLVVAGASLVHSQLPPLQGLKLTPVVFGLQEPVAGTLQPGSDRIFINERSGRVRVVEDGVLLEVPAIDLTGRVESGFIDQGLLGIDFHPRHPADQRVFLSYTEATTGAQVVSSFIVQPDGRSFDAGSETEIIRVPQPHYSHQGGTIRFGPDGMLWMGFGDGGFLPPDGPRPESQDPLRHGQNRFTLPGKVVRVDVDLAVPYSIPPDNPFVDGAAGLPEIWAYGVRNPWSLWFDTRWVIVGDVGHVHWEEINLLDRHDDAGANLGWSEMEGSECFIDRDCAAVAATATYPWMVVPNAEICGVVVGPVYRGRAIPELVGELFFADYCGRSGIRSVPLAEAAPTSGIERVLTPNVHPTGFVIGPNGEVYLTVWEGTLYRIDPVR